MPKHTELSSIKFNRGSNRFCLDIIEGGDYAFVWRGNKRSKNGFVLRPAHFDWRTLGILIKQSFNEGKISKKEMQKFLDSLMK